jgi:hypothetical protein
MATVTHCLNRWNGAVGWSPIENLSSENEYMSMSSTQPITAGWMADSSSREIVVRMDDDTICWKYMNVSSVP